MVMEEPLEFSRGVSINKQNKIRWRLNQCGCEWCKYVAYTKEENNFVHIDPECYTLNNLDSKLIKYDNIFEAFGKNRKVVCKFCGNVK